MTQTSGGAPFERIFMIGPMGAGKTVIGRYLADQMGWAFLDTDHMIQAELGTDIPTIFSIEGEAGFRRHEHTVLTRIMSHQQTVIATGGGSVLLPENRALLTQHSRIVLVLVDPALQLERTRIHSNRPILESGDPGETLRRLWRERRTLYHSLADFILDSSRGHPKALAASLLPHLCIEPQPET
jgi:shikimate kinase